MERIERHASHGGWQEVWTQDSDALGCATRFGVYLPPQAQAGRCPVLYWLSGLTCTEQNFLTKAGAQRFAAEHGLILVAPDTSPRGEDVADDAAWDLGQGAGFYVNATEAPWVPHYRMYDYVVDELPALVEKHFPASDVRAVSGHSMGGHGALVIALRNPGRYASVSAFAPIAAPSHVQWGQKAFAAYLGDDRGAWAAWDACELIAASDKPVPAILVDQGTGDPFLEDQLRPELLREACERADQPLELRMQPGYDHSYYFVASFIGEHVARHAQLMR